MTRSLTLPTGALALALTLLAPASALAVPAPMPDKGDTAWMLTATVLVILMTIPGLALFYGGMVRAKNVLSVLMQVFLTFSLLAVLWAVYGYSLAFTPGNAFIGGFEANQDRREAAGLLGLRVRFCAFGLGHGHRVADDAQRGLHRLHRCADRAFKLSRRAVAGAVNSARPHATLPARP